MSERPASTQAEHAGRIPALEGLRGIAIASVLIYHGMQLSATNPNNSFDQAVSRLTNTGWAGVDLFFVLSGFLITGILLDSRGTVRTLGVFYARRALRIFPVYVSLLLILLVVLPILLPSFRNNADLEILRSNQAWYWLFLLNFKVALEPLESLGRFGNGHLWSLMVEEQFYLIWPFIVLLLSRRFVLIALILCIVGAPLFRYAVVEGAFPRIDNGFSSIVLLPARVDALAWGGLVALAFRDATVMRLFKQALPPLGALAVLVLLLIALQYGQLWPYDRSMQIVGFSAIAIVGALAVNYAATDGTSSSLHALLACAPLRFLGKYSYALYVFHYQVVVELARHWNDRAVLGTHVPSRLAFTTIVIGISIAISWLAWHTFESRFLALKRYVPNERQPAESVVVAESPSA